MHSIRSRVHCSEQCTFKIGEDDALTGRIREFNWLGFVIDQLDPQLQSDIERVSTEKCKIHFGLPRDFGNLEVYVKSAVINKYFDEVLQKNFLSLTVVLDEGPELERIQTFISYRNRRFQRHKRTKAKNQFFNKKFLALFLVGLIFVTMLSIVLWRYFSSFFD